MHNKHLAFCGLSLGDLVVFGSWPGSLSPVRQNPSPAHSCWSLFLCAWWQALRWSLGFALPKPTFLPFPTLLCRQTSTLTSNSFIVSPNWNLITWRKWHLLCSVTETLVYYLYQPGVCVCVCVLYKCACVCVLAWLLIYMCVSGCWHICASSCGGQMLNLHVFFHFPHLNGEVGAIAWTRAHVFGVW